MSTKTIHFTIGENFGNMITQIAKEHTIEDKDIKWGIRTLTQSLVGMPDKMALEIILGYKKIVTNVKAQDNSIEPSTGPCDYMNFNTENVDIRIRKINNIARKLIEHLRDHTSKIRNNPVYFEIEMLTPKFLNNNDDLIIKHIDKEFQDFRYFINSCTDFIKRSLKYYAWIQEFQNSAKKFNLTITKELNNYTIEMPKFLLSLYSYIQELESGLDVEVPEIVSEARIELDAYIEAIEEMDKEEEKGITKKDPKDNWNAGFISQEGDYYALNGEIANMLHLNLANMMVKAGLIPEDFGDEVTADSWLERQGWVKIHGNHVLYSGYDNSKLGGVDVPISKAQLDVITIIIRHHHLGIIWPGMDPANKMSVLTWAQSDPIQFKLKWFKF